MHAALQQAGRKGPCLRVIDLSNKQTPYQDVSVMLTSENICRVSQFDVLYPVSHKLPLFCRPGAFKSSC